MTSSVIILALVAALRATPTPSPSPLPVIGTVHVATGSAESLHRLPLPASLLDCAAIENAPATTGDALLASLPGFDRNRSNSWFTNYGQLRVSFAGAGNDRGLVLADGVPAQDGFGGQVDWAAYPAFDLERAELLRGPGSALYGSGAIGGVLSLETFGPLATTASPEGAIAFAAGSHAFSQQNVKLATALGRKLALGVAAFDGALAYDDLPPGYASPIDRAAQAQDQMTSLRLRYAASPQTVFSYGYRGAWDYQQEGRPNYDFSRRSVQNALHVAHATAHASLSADLWQRSGFVTNRADVYPRAPGTLLYTQLVPTHESGASLQWLNDAGWSTFEVRADARFVSGVSEQFNGAGAFSSSGSGVQRSGGIALQETLRARRLEFVAGVRGDAIALIDAATVKGAIQTPLAPRTDRALSPRAALRYDLARDLALRLSAGGGFRAPYLNELVRGYVIGPVSYLPNPGLVPERSSSLSGGFDWTRGRSELSADFVHGYVNDAIDFCTVSATVQERCNFTHVRTDGTTLVFARRVGSCARMTLSANQQYARITTGTPAEIGKQLPYVPKISASGSYDAPVGAVDAGLSLTYSGPTFADDLNAQPLGSAVTLGAHARVPLRGGAALVVDASNLTDARYLSSIDRYAPPQVISLALQGRIGAPSHDACSP